MEQLLVDALLPLVVTTLGGLAYAVRKWLATKLAPEQYATLQQLSRTAVAAAEQLGDDFGVNGQAKYDFAKKFVVSAAKRVGVKVRDEEALAFIEAALREFKEVFEQPLDLEDDVLLRAQQEAP